MSYSRRQIMQDAWAIARRFAGNGETWGQRLSRALKSVWWQAKEAALVAAEVARKLAAEAARFATMSAASIRAEIAMLENAPRLSSREAEQLAAARRALPVAVAHEAEPQADENEAKRALIARAGGRFCAVTFIKADGSRRVMRVQPAALKLHVKGDAASEAGRKAAATRAERHPHLMPVWDADAKAPRSVNLATVLTIKVDGARHDFHPMQ